MGRIEKLYDFLEVFMEEKFQNACKDMQQVYHEKDTKVSENIRQSLRDMLLKTIALQMEEKNERVKYFTISYLKHSINVDRWCFCFETFNSTFYLDENDTRSYFYPDIFWSFFQKDMKYFKEVLQESFIKIQPYEIEWIKVKYISYYNSIILKLFQDLLPAILEMEEWEQVSLAEDFKIIFNDYMSEGVLLYEKGVDVT